MPEVIIKAGLVIFALAAAAGVKYILHWNDDNSVEEVAELVIKEETGADIDLSPASKE